MMFHVFLILIIDIPTAGKGSAYAAAFLCPPELLSDEENRQLSTPHTAPGYKVRHTINYG